MPSDMIGARGDRYFPYVKWTVSWPSLSGSASIFRIRTIARGATKER